MKGNYNALMILRKNNLLKEGWMIFNKGLLTKNIKLAIDETDDSIVKQGLKKAILDKRISSLFFYLFIISFVGIIIWNNYTR